MVKRQEMPKGEKKMIMLVIVIPIAMMFTGMGIYAMRKPTPMHFFSGTTVDASEITDVRAYNRENGIMWLVFSLVFWLSAIIGSYNGLVGGFILIGGCVIGVPGLLVTYNFIYSKYEKKGTSR